MSIILSKEEARVYSSYRLVLRNLRKSNICNPNTRTGARKQEALKMVSDSRKLPISAVKSIVRKEDEINNVTHEHTGTYALDLHISNMLKDAQAQYDLNPQPCSCGNTEDVKARLNPFEAEIYDNYEVMVTCYKCYYNVELDI